MADIRDSIKLATDKTLAELSSKPQPKTLSATPPTPDAPDARTVLERARQELEHVADEDVIDNDFVHTEDMHLALLLSALEIAREQSPSANMKGPIAGTHKYDTTDPNWILSALNMVIHKKVPFIGHVSLDDFRVQMPEGDVSVAIAGDWGTGLFTSNQIAAQMAAKAPLITLHLGDVYYSGTKDEVFKKFLTKWPRGSFGTFALNSNHEMYAGGDGYFNVTLKNPDFAKQQASYFCLYNSKWQLIGLDSAYDSPGGIHLYQNGNLRASQLQWLIHQLQVGKQKGLRSVILTHHNPISIDGTLDAPFYDQIVTAATGNPFDYWYWGHEHDAAVYAPLTRGGLTYRGRCIGHGGIPYSPEAIGPTKKDPSIVVDWTEQEKYVPPAGDARAGLNGFAVITLPQDGSDIREEFFDDSGRLRYSSVAPLPVSKGLSAAAIAAMPGVQETKATPAPVRMPDKVIVTNRGRLTAKYGPQMAAIDNALQNLIAADANRKLVTQVIHLDDAADMAKVKAAPVTQFDSPQENKVAIDAIFSAITPDYLVILGGPDVVPHQDLQNPMYGGGDVDEFAYSDLPYACDAGYSQNITDFMGPTRVVGRIPDLPNVQDPSLLLSCLATAANWKTRPISDYASALGLSTVEWEQSTTLSISNIFGGGAPPLKLAPNTMLSNDLSSVQKAIAQFFNLHGASRSQFFYGQQGGNYPIAHDSQVLVGQRFDGTIVAAECCYGGELYDPAGQSWAICARYLEGGAYAYFGASTIAYGPSSGNGQADVLCQKFLKKAIAGSSTGRAVLESRLDYISNTPDMSPQDLKTLAQFYLLGDPSIQAAQPPMAKTLGAVVVNESYDRAQRRKTLASRGEALQKSKPVARRKRVAAELPAEVRAQFDKLTTELDLEKPAQIASFSVERRDQGGAGDRFEMKALGGPGVESNYHLVIGKRKNSAAPHLPNVVAFVAKEAGGKLLSYTELHSK